MTTRTRHYEIDGMRGWACVSVMFSHLFFGVFLNTEPRFIPVDWRFLMEPFLGGTLAVAIFFILSGDVLSASYWFNPAPSGLVRHTVKRYARLTVPVLGASIVVFVLIKLGLTWHHQVAGQLHVQNWLGSFLQGDFDLIDLFRFACVTVYFEPPTGRMLLPFLWTMRVEMLGSLLVLVYLYADFAIRRRYAFILFIMLFCMAADSMLACFPIGMLAANIRARGGFDWARRQIWSDPLCLIGFALALVVGTWCNRVMEGFLLPSIIAGTVAVACVYANDRLSRFFSTPISIWLGKISFPIFLLQFPVIISFTSGMALLALNAGILSTAMIWLIVATSGALCLIVSRLFLPVEIWASRAGDAVCDLVLADDKR
jgi:peptidoglycan/LPS O-acetylase OafA/YrhL